MLDVETKTDEQLIAIIRTSDREMYSEIMKRYENKLLRYATFLVRDFDTASDVVQESFIKAFINLNNFNESKKFSSWIYRIVHNESVNSLKKNKHSISMPEDIDFPDDSDVAADIERKDVINELKMCLSKLSLDYSEPLILFYIENKTYEEISNILRIPIGTVATHISRAKKLLKKICGNKLK